MNLSDRLRAETADAHKAVEDARLLKSIFEADFSLHHYRILLEHWHAFFIHYDAVLSGFGFQSYRYAPRLPGLYHDLAWLCPIAGSSVEYHDWIPANRAEQLGAAYVLEGSTLGARIICKRLRETLGSAVEPCMRFYAMQTVRWPAFRRWLDAESIGSHSECHKVVRAANQTFAAMQRHMDAFQTTGTVPHAELEILYPPMGHPSVS